jgi:hypothetical protein
MPKTDTAPNRTNLKEGAYLQNFGRPELTEPSDPEHSLMHKGRCVLVCRETKEIGFVLGRTARAHFTTLWDEMITNTTCTAASLRPDVAQTLVWHKLAALAEAFDVKPDLIVKRMADMRPATALLKPPGIERLDDAVSKGVMRNGKRMELVQLCAELGISYVTMRSRLKNPNLTMEQCLQPERILPKNATMHVTDPEVRKAREKSGLSYGLFYQRYRRLLDMGVSPERARQQATMKPPRRYFFKGLMPIAQPGIDVFLQSTMTPQTPHEAEESPEVVLEAQEYNLEHYLERRARGSEVNQADIDRCERLIAEAREQIRVRDAKFAADLDVATRSPCGADEAFMDELRAIHLDD